MAALKDPDTIDLPLAAVGKPASLRSAAFPTAMSITPCVIDLLNIQDTKTRRGIVVTVEVIEEIMVHPVLLGG